jgi:hypothetical protein
LHIQIELSTIVFGRNWLPRRLPMVWLGGEANQR